MEKARDRLAALLTRTNGEYLFRIGNQPPRPGLYSDELTDETPSWTGIARTAEDVNILCSRLTTIVEEIGGKVNFFI